MSGEQSACVRGGLGESGNWGVGISDTRYSNITMLAGVVGSHSMDGIKFSFGGSDLGRVQYLRQLEVCACIQEKKTDKPTITTTCVRS